MSSLEVKETLTVEAEPDRVWKLLLDPERIVTCLPGAGLDEVIDDRNFRGNIKVKVGPVTVAYKGKATLTEVDEANKKVVLVGEGREKVGTGTVKMTMNSQLLEVKPGTTEVQIAAEVGLTGKVVSFGRGMIQAVSKEIFAQFGDRLRGQLAADAPAETNAPASEAARAVAPAEEPQAVNGIALLFKVLMNSIRDVFSRLFGRAPSGS